MCKKNIGLVVLFFSGFLLAVAQEKEKDIGTQVVNVVKPYTPTISDAFKIKEIPSLDDSVTTRKKNIKYSIFSVPVASTFTPAKGKAQVVKRAPKEVLYNTYVSLGVGNYSSILADFYTSRALSRNETFDIGLNHHSSQGGIAQVSLDDFFYNSKLEADYTNRSKNLEWSVNGGFQHQIYNWYGLPMQVFPDASAYQANEKQVYYNAFAGSSLAIEDAFFKGGEINIRRFWDRLDSQENRVVFAPEMELPIGEELVQLTVKADFLDGNFESDYLNSSSIAYSYLQIGASPSLTILRDDLTVKLGANLIYGMDLENSESDFYIYPNVTASYRVVNEYVIAYGGIDGTLQQNSYHGFASENPFVSPTLQIIPTDRQYNAYVGLKGKLHKNVGYNLKGSYMAENNKAFYALNPVNNTANPNAGYAYGNSFSVLYDDVKTISVFGELSVDVNRNFTLRANAEVFDFNTENQQEAWNMPTLKGSLIADYQITDKWYMGATIFYIGERKDYFYSLEPLSVTTPQIVSLDAYLDANAHLGYRFNNQLSAFVKLNNIANNKYARWAFYNVMGFQVMAGATYKFDW